MNDETEYLLADADATETLGRHLAALIPDAGIALALSGPLGAGKSSLARALLRGLGVDGAIPSPTYTLVEPYMVYGREVYHVDLYRIDEDEELEMLGLAELAEGAVLLLEWPERDLAHRLRFDLTLALAHRDRSRGVRFLPHTPVGEKFAQAATEWLQ
ncbi:MAG: tRNA (adenosine(37)-N6)-threonylcarbamoyltransferase complex ATPase subunit type 1 TsaE [Gammaproteobacteria bacterium]